MLFLSVLPALAACSKTKQPPPRVVPVVAEAAGRKSLPLQIRAIGNVEAYNTVSVRSQVSGEISEVFFGEGQDVKQGKMLFRIDTRPFEAALRQAYGAKEVGEGSISGMLAAIANAIYDAIGIRFKELPITPEKVLEALWRK